MNKVITKLKFIRDHQMRFWLMLYIPFYVICFTLLEKRTNVRFHDMACPIDYKIPFLPIFIIPYMLWFFYVGYGIVYLIFRDRSLEYYLMIGALGVGMTIFILVSWLYPNMIDLRPKTINDSNLITRTVAWLYSKDTPTNVFPSIHVYNSITVHAGLLKTERYHKRKYLKWISLCYIILVILATMFIKQHSIIDVLGAIAMALIVCPIFYSKKNEKNMIRLIKKYDKNSDL